MRSVIASVVGLAANIVINVWATLEGWLNANAWGSTVVLALLLLGGAYQLSIGARKTVVNAHRMGPRVWAYTSALAECRSGEGHLDIGALSARPALD